MNFGPVTFMHIGAPSPLEQVITAQEASKILGVTTRQVQRLCKTNVLKNRYADGVYLILKESLKEYKK